MKIYVVTQGKYSGYHIITATTDESLAKTVAKKFDTQFNPTRIEVFDDAQIMLKPCWFVMFDTKGSVLHVYEDSEHYDGYRQLNQFNICKPSGRLYTYVLADDSASAVKIAAEKRAQYLTEETGIA